MRNGTVLLFAALTALMAIGCEKKPDSVPVVAVGFQVVEAFPIATGSREFGSLSPRTKVISKEKREWIAAIGSSFREIN